MPLPTIVPSADLPQSSITVSLQPGAAGPEIPADFAGLSFEMKHVLPDANGRHTFQPSNTALSATLHCLGVRNLRIGGNTTDTPSVPIPTHADLDDLFGFVAAAGVKAIFTLRLRRGDPQAAAARAKYLTDHYAKDILHFAIGNEPDFYYQTYPSFLADIRKYIDAITEAAPQAVFCGPGTTHDRAEWTRQFATDLGPEGRIRLITQHEYPGGDAHKVTDPEKAAAARDRLLAPNLPSTYQRIHDSFVPATVAAGLPYRIEEINSLHNGGAKDVSDTLAAGLWALDYLRWWAAHGASGINFHTGDWVAAADDFTPCHYTAIRTSAAGYAVHPVGYALKAFTQGGRGRSMPAEVSSNPDGVNLTAYSVLADDGAVTVTLVNKEHGVGAKPACVRLAADSHPSARTMILTAAGGETATTGLTLGGSAIGDDASWSGSWQDEDPADGSGYFSIAVPTASAVIVTLAGRAPSG